MCLTIPMQIKSIDGFEAVCVAKGIERVASLFMMQGEQLEVGDFVMIQTGYAVQKVTAEDARMAWQSFDEILDMLDQSEHTGRDN